MTDYKLIVEYGDEYMGVTAAGLIGRPAIGMAPSGQWKLLGAVERNNLGGWVRSWTLAEIRAAPESIPWRFKNGKQRVFIRDLDHGAVREWRSPQHRLMTAPAGWGQSRRAN